MNDMNRNTQQHQINLRTIMLSKTSKSKETRYTRIYFYKAQSKAQLNNRYMLKLYERNLGSANRIQNGAYLG